MRDIQKIIVHCSNSYFGDAELIDRWHKDKGWNGIGYHYVILSGRRTSTQPYCASDDGTMEVGRPHEDSGAHCMGHNNDSLGICLIGKDGLYTGKQILAMGGLVHTLRTSYSLPLESVYGHRDFNNAKTCPDIDTSVLRHLAGG